MSRFHVDGKVVDKVDLLRKKHAAWRLDVWPFAMLYLLWLTMVVPSIDFVDAAIVLGGLAVTHILVLLFTTWSVDFKCFVQYSKVNNIRLADVCKVTPAKFCGSKEIASSSSAKDVEEIYFDFRKQCFIYSEEEDTFCKLPYPTKETFGYYLKCSGHGSDAKVLAATEKWGRNVFEYPQPTFQKLMKEHCMEPFFVFQVFCVGLWCLDEYWYYSLFTLFMLFMFESTMAKSRLKTLSELRRVRVDSQTLMVHRCGKWVKLSGTDLLPGDVVSIGRSSGQNEEDKSVPADMLILAGSAIVNEAILTGESTPQWKVSIAGRGIEEKLSAKRDKNHMLFGGTKILQHTADKSFPLRTPDGGCLAVVLRTGFETSQGKLMRTILFSTERVTANSWESGLFILFLVVFAIIAAGYVLKKGLEDPTRSKYKLFLSCSLIITSVIPPELPMELSIAVNTSLIALARRGIFCTEPFRIPFAGKVDICCFDKTGTLTSDDMEFSGVVGLNDSSELESDMTKVPSRTVEILASCHALVFVDNKLVGDPLEKAALKGIDWSYKSDEKAIPKKFICLGLFGVPCLGGVPVNCCLNLQQIVNGEVNVVWKLNREVSEARSMERDTVECGLTFAGFAVFNCPIRADSLTVLSELKNSSHDLVMITGDQALTACHVAGQVNIVSKPALILVAVKNSKGYEWVSPDETERIPYSENEVEALSETHDLCIGGDCFEMLQQTSAVLRVIPFVKVFARVAPEQKELIMTTFKTVGRLTLMCGDGTNDVGALKQVHCAAIMFKAFQGSGNPVQIVQRHHFASHLKRMAVVVRVQEDFFAFVKGAPETIQDRLIDLPPTYVETYKKYTRQGSRVLALAYKSLPDMTVYCAAIMFKAFQAHVGVALLNAVPPTKSESSSGTSKDENTKALKSKKSKPTVEATGNSEASSKGKVVPRSESSNNATSNRHLNAAEKHRQKLKKMMNELNEEGDGRSAPIVKLGDASMASPFTAKHASVAPTTDIIRQGRSTLVTTLQMFKILGLNCLATAYVLSVMYLDGVKLAARPHPNIFCSYVFLSLMGQFAMHLLFLISSVKEAEKHMPEECIEPESEFHPNLVNTVSYMVSMMLQVATFAVNYMGHPFNQSIPENKPFLYALGAAAGFFVVITSDLFRDLNDWLSLVPLPVGLRDKLLLWALLMFLCCYAWERLLRWAFPGKIPAWRKRQRVAAASSEKKLV
ncbi:hypothetical protein GOBAR_DD08496 [Gossypium barbadense]|nr:hypothetical protein GOBAR_DD08496 [Gossypium barbadense]